MDKNKCSSCGEAPHKCSCKNKDFTKAVIEINNPEQITLMRKVVIPVSMGDDTTVPPVVGKYHNVLLYYEANQKSYLYSSDGIPTQLVNGVTDYEAAINLPQINSHTLIGDKTGDQLDLQNKLTAGDNITIENNVISATDTTYGPATDTEIGLVKPGDGLEVDANGTMSISDIEQYAHFFDTVADMKAATNLTDSSYARTLGFYTRNDKGGATYKIRAKAVDDTPDEMTLIALADNTLIAELVKTEVMNAKQFGAKGDGVTDDTNNIQTAINYNLNIEIPSGTYMIDAETSIKPVSHSRIKLDKDATLKAITNSATNYYVIYVHDVEDVEISGGTIEGERDEHTGTSGQWGHCIYLLGIVTDVYIHDINLINAWGDGFCCNISGKACTERVHVDRARRNGFSIIQADSFISTDDFIENTIGTNPQCGVDIEPNNASDILRNVVFNNLYTKNNYSAGLMAALIGGNTSDNFTSIKVNNFRSDYDRRGLQFNIKAGRLGDFVANNPVITNSSSDGILIDTFGLFPITINHPVIKYYRVSAASNVGLRIQGAGQNVSEEHGNIWINNAEITDPISTTETPVVTNWAMDIGMSTATMKNIHVHSPINLDGRRIRFIGGVNCSIDDEYKVTKLDTDSNRTISRDLMTIYNTTSSYTTNRYIIMREDQKFAVGQQFHFTNTGDYTLTVRFPGQHIYPLSSDAGKYVTLETKGSSMVIERISDDSWAVVSQTGTLTVTN